MQYLGNKHMQMQDGNGKVNLLFLVVGAKMRVRGGGGGQVFQKGDNGRVREKGNVSELPRQRKLCFFSCLYGWLLCFTLPKLPTYLRSEY